ncbi:hypothetical protein E2C01_037045 [Portunus trituberculatus]|uniref:Uncharacterized protein n=1 Tax=Portunus trituberculatus TaxID=210409 RepID=A0A5B7FDQ5_PORTR|nr:hypothetical protein [Portunus trituberculatus]
MRFRGSEKDGEIKVGESPLRKIKSSRKSTSTQKQKRGKKERFERVVARQGLEGLGGVAWEWRTVLAERVRKWQEKRHRGASLTPDLSRHINFSVTTLRWIRSLPE